MGTRCLTFITTNEEMPIICMYRQMDGYPEGHGRELAEFLAPIRMVNGLSESHPGTVDANGAECLAAQLVAHFKDGPGGIYLYRPNKNMDAGQDYEYWIDVMGDPGTIQVRVYTPSIARKKLFKGTVAEFAAWCANYD